MTWVRELRIAEVPVVLTIEGLSPESEAMLGRKYAPFLSPIAAHEERFHVTLLRSPERDYPPQDPPIQAEASSPFLSIRLRGLEAKWNSTTREISGHFTNNIPQPIENLLRFIVTRTLLLRGGGCFHAAAVLDQQSQKALVVLGQSEAGKTTLAGIYGRPATLSDEMPALVPQEDGSWRVYSTPFWGDMGWGEASGDWPLGALLVLVGKESFSADKASGSMAQQALLARIFNYSDEPALSQAAFGVCQSLAEAGANRLSYHKEEDRADLQAKLADLIGGKSD